MEPSGESEQQEKQPEKREEKKARERERERRKLEPERGNRASRQRKSDCERERVA